MLQAPYSQPLCVDARDSLSVRQQKKIVEKLKKKKDSPTMPTVDMRQFTDPYRRTHAWALCSLCLHPVALVVCTK